MPTATPFSNLITFSRGSNATVTGSNGLIQWAPNNLLTFSEQFDNAAWIKQAGTVVTANQAVAPDGTTTADLVVGNGTNGFFLAVGALGTGTVATTKSIYLRGVSGGETVILKDAAATVGTTTCNLTTAWQRFTLTETVGVNSQLWVDDIPAGGIYVWGAQVELGSTATTYNPTSVKNLLGFSEAFDNAAWGKTNLSTVVGAAANPVNGLFNAQKLMDNTTAATRNINQNATTTANPWTFSVYAKAAERNWIAIGFNDSSNTLQLTFFNVATGAVGNLGTGATASVTSVGSGWYRCSVTMPAFAGSNFARIYLASANGTISYTGDGNSGIFIYGAQLSNSASLDPYVPTPAAAPSSTAYYGPRFDFDPVTRQPRGILIEEQRTNLLTYSEQFDNAAWTKVAVTVPTTNGIAPDGNATADTLQADGTSSQHYVNQSGVPSGSAHVFSIYAKAGTASFLNIQITGANIYAQWNILTGALVFSGAGTGTLTSTAQESVGNGWYRLAVAFTQSSGSTQNVRLHVLDAAVNSPNPTTSASGNILIWGAQLEAGGFATSYIPTIASTVTRSVDVATISGSLFSQWYRQDAGTFVASCSMLALSTATTQELLETDSGGVANAITLRANNTVGQTSSTATTASVSQGFIDISGAAANTLQNVALGVSTNNTAMVRNGGAVGSDATYAVPTGLIRISLGSRTNSGAPLNGHIRSIRYIPARAADFQLQALTT
jgi:hypothetical protein